VIRETRQAFRTTAFLVFLAVLVGLALAVEVTSGGRDFFRADKLWLYLAILASGYLVSRGLAKAGSSDDLSISEGGSADTDGSGMHGYREAQTGAAALPEARAPEGKRRERRASRQQDSASRQHDKVQAERLALPTSSSRRAASHSRPTRAPGQDPFERVLTFANRFARIVRRTILVAAILLLVAIALIVWLITRLF